MTAALSWSLLLGLLAADPVPPELALAARLYNEGRYELVLDTLATLNESNLDQAQASQVLYLRADSVYQLGRTPDQFLEAAQLFERFLTGEGLTVPPPLDATVPASRRDLVESALFHLARARQQLGQPEQALPLFQAALALFPDGPFAGETLFRESETLESLGRLEEARQGYAILSARQPVAALTLESSRRVALLDANLGRLAEAEQGLGELLATLEAAVSIPGGTAALEETVRYDLGNLYLNSGRHDEAAAEFTRSLERFPQGPGRDRNLYRLAQARYGAGRFQDAADVFRRLIDTEPSSPLVPDALLWLGWSYHRLALDSQARAAWEQLQTDFPGGAAAALAAAAVAQQVETASPPEAVALWARLAETYPDQPLAPLAMFRAGLLALESLEPATAALQLQRYRELFTADERIAESYVWEGMAHELAGLPAMASDAFHAYLARTPVESATAEGAAARPDLRAAALTGFARSLRALGDPHGAAAFLQPQLAKPGGKEPIFRDAWLLLGDLLFETGRPQEALPAYRHVVSFTRGDPTEARAAFRVAECLESLGNQKDAALEFVKVAYLYDSVPSVATLAMIRSADLFEKLENYREAVRSYRKALELSPTDEQKTQIGERLTWLEQNLPLLELDLPRKQ